MESHTVARWAVTLSGRAIFMGAALLLCSATPALADPCTAIPDRGPVPPWLHKGAQFSGPVAYIGDGDSLCVAAVPGREVDQSTWVEVRVADFYAPELHEAGGPEAKAALLVLADQLHIVADQIGRLERRLMAWHRQDPASQRLATIPGVGFIGATALSASIPDPVMFRSGREFAAFLGLVPRQNSSGGKDRLGRISKMGDGYLRKLLVVGATSVIRRAKADALAAGPWVRSLLERRPARVVTVAMANKTARIAWAILTRGEVYRPIPA